MPVLLIQAFVLAQPVSSPPGGNTTPNFDSATINGDLDVTVPEGTDAQVTIGNDTGSWGNLKLDAGSEDFYIETAVGGTPNSNQMVLSSGTGNVGIGNNNPGNTLTVGDAIGGLALGTAVVATDTTTNSAMGVGESLNLYGTMQWDVTNDNLRLYAVG